MQKLCLLSIINFALLVCLLSITSCSSSVSPTEKPISIEMSDSEYEPMNDYFERLLATFSGSSRVELSEEMVDELFPAKEIPADKLSWFLESYDDVTVEAIKGIRFNNNDILIFYFYSTEVSDKIVLEHVTININMYGRPLIPPLDVYEYSGSYVVDDGFGVIAYSFYGSEMDDIIVDIASDAKVSPNDS